MSIACTLFGPRDFCALAAFDWAVDAIRSRRADVRPLISAQLPLAQSQAAFELALDRQCSTKVQLILDATPSRERHKICQQR